MIDERIQNIVQLNQNVDFISQSEQYLKYIKKYKNKLQLIDIQNIYNNLSRIDIQLLNSRYNTSHTIESISESNVITTSAIAEMKQINKIYQNINNSKFINSGMNISTNCKINYLEPLRCDYSVIYLNLEDMSEHSTFENLKYPTAALVVRRSLMSLEFAPNYFENPILLSEIRSDDIELPYNEQYTYHMSFLYKTRVIGEAQQFFQLRIFTSQLDTIPLTFNNYYRVQLSNEYTTYSTQFNPAPLVNDDTKCSIKFSFYLNRNNFKNNNILLFLTNINIWIQNVI